MSITHSITKWTCKECADDIADNADQEDKRFALDINKGYLLNHENNSCRYANLFVTELTLIFQ